MPHTHTHTENNFSSYLSPLRLRQTGIQIRFVTNTTKESGQTLLNRLTTIGFRIQAAEIYSSLSAAAQYVRNTGLKNPFYMLSDDARTEFPVATDANDFDAVVVGLAPAEQYSYDRLTHAFRIVLGGRCPLIAVHEGRYYRRSDGLAVGPGLYTRGLEYAAGTRAIVVGKPNRYFFETAIPATVQPHECCMIGDVSEERGALLCNVEPVYNVGFVFVFFFLFSNTQDAIDDVNGAMAIGMKGILVKTGKYLPTARLDCEPTAILDNFSAAVDWIAAHFDCE